MRVLTILFALVSLPASAAGPLNDTGIRFCGAYPTGNAAAPCTPDPAGQDRRYGRDAAAASGQLAKTGAGDAGFDFTRVCMSGELAGQGSCPASPVLGSGANDWACTKDNVTGLIWEVKTGDGGLRDKDATYSNYDDPDRPQKWTGSAFVNPTQADIDAAYNSIGYVNAVNALTGIDRLCGATDWRRPTKKELAAIVHYGRAAPAIDTDYFPNSGNSGAMYYWSGSPRNGFAGGAWYVEFDEGAVNVDYRDQRRSVRLVRGGQ